MIPPLLPITPLVFKIDRFFNYPGAGKIIENIEGVPRPCADNCFCFPGIQPFKPESPAVRRQQTFYPVATLKKAFFVIAGPGGIPVEDVPYFFEIPVAYSVF
jgi:hypothetical protein